MGIIRRLAARDAEPMLAWMHDSEVVRYFQYDFMSQTLADVERFIAGSFTPTNQHFAITDEQDSYLGTISLKNIDRKNNKAEYAIATARVAHGKGYALAATREILRYAFSELRLHRVYLNVLTENARANAFYKKCGFRYEGILADAIYVDGKYHSLALYAAINDLDEK